MRRLLIVATVCALPAAPATVAIRQLDAEFEGVSASLRVPIGRTVLRVTVLICLTATLEVAVYVFVNVMTIVWRSSSSTVRDTKPASVTAVHMDEAGQASAAAAMAILGSALTAKIVPLVLASVADRLTQAWWRR
jgi:iron(III) transport system permease protein